MLDGLPVQLFLASPVGFEELLLSVILEISSPSQRVRKGAIVNIPKKGYPS